MSSPRVWELRTGATPAGETRHACWVIVDDPSDLLPLSLCGRGRYRLTGLYPPDWTEPNCVRCIRVLLAADRAATAVMVHGDEHGWCPSCDMPSWLPTSGDWLCWTCRDREDRAERAGFDDAAEPPPFPPPFVGYDPRVDGGGR